MIKTTLSLILAAGGLLAAGAAPSTLTDSPYGICSHVSRPAWDWPYAARNFDRMNQAGIRWVRTDWDWYTVEAKPGQWNFTEFDRLTRLARQKNINILPILASPTWAAADIRNGRYDAWKNYVRTVVGRYGRQLRFWEVWNEPNYTNWLTPGQNYVPLLKASYEEIKKIDPGIQVLHAAACGMAFDYLEQSFRTGSGNFFDVMNLHPYNWNTTPERLLLPDLDKLKALMKKYQLDRKPIWITETGWATSPAAPDFWMKQIPAALEHLGIDQGNSAMALVCDPEEGVNGFFIHPAERYFPGFKKIKKITLRELEQLDSREFPVLVPTVRWSFPARYVPALVNYVTRGGTLILPCGQPLRHDIQREGENRFRTVPADRTLLKALHIDWFSADKLTWHRVSPEFTGRFEYKADNDNSLLSDRNLKPGDRFIPMVEAGNARQKGAKSAIYQLNSDRKGNVIVNLDWHPLPQLVSEETQAAFLPRTALIAFSRGVERFFWYSLRSRGLKENDRESHFGILRSNLVPKPAYHAYRTLTRLCPPGSTTPTLRQAGDLWIAAWKQPDGTGVWAAWTELAPRQTRLTFSGKLSGQVNLLGRELPPAQSGETVVITPEITYFVGPDSLDLL